MTNTFAVLVYSPMLVINILLLFSIIFKKKKLHVDDLYIVLCLLLIGWLVFELLYYLLQSAEGIIFVYSAKFIFAAFIPTVFLYLVISCYHLQKNIPRWANVLLMLMPTSTALISMTNKYHELFRTNVWVSSINPLTIIHSGMGTWYYFNLVFTQIPVLIIAGIVLTQHFKLPKAYRATVNLLLMGLGVYALGFIMEMSTLTGQNSLDTNLIGICGANLLFYIGVSSNGRADYLNIWRRDTFDYLDEAVLIINNAGVLVDANHPAERLFQSIGLEWERLPMDEFKEELAASGKVLFRRLEDAEHRLHSDDIYFLNGAYPVIYATQLHKISGRTPADSGAFMVLSEVTRNRLLIERLQGLAGVDPLTGLKNRFGYEQALRELDQAENLPISIIMGDVNGLKALNDTEGHQAGDELLKTIADILQQCCPYGNVVARIGGDEFALLLKRCTGADAAGLIEDIQAAVKATDGTGKVSIALGSATKSRPEDNINALIGLADATMYTNKRAGGPAYE